MIHHLQTPDDKLPSQLIISPDNHSGDQTAKRGCTWKRIWSGGKEEREPDAQRQSIPGAPSPLQPQQTPLLQKISNNVVVKWCEWETSPILLSMEIPIIFLLWTLLWAGLELTWWCFPRMILPPSGRPDLPYHHLRFLILYYLDLWCYNHQRHCHHCGHRHHHLNHCHHCVCTSALSPPSVHQRLPVSVQAGSTSTITNIILNSIVIIIIVIII